MKILSTYLKVSAFLAAMALVTNAKADATLLGLSNGTTGDQASGNYGSLLLGVAFTPTENLTMTQMGAYAADFLDGNDKTTQDFTAVLYSFNVTPGTNGVYGSGIVLDNAVIAAGTGVDSNNVAFTTLGTPITLTAGTEYFIGAIGGTPSDYGDTDVVQWGNSQNTFAANIHYLTSGPDVTLDTSGYSSFGELNGAADSPASVGVGGVADFYPLQCLFCGRPALHPDSA